jgi:hypothetical protein
LHRSVPEVIAREALSSPRHRTVGCPRLRDEDDKDDIDEDGEEVYTEEEEQDTGDGNVA